MRRLRVLLSILLCLASSFVYSQFTDNFADGNFTANPVWSGDNGKWEILVDTLHLNRLPAAADTAYLSTPSAALCNGIWEFRLKLKFAPSTVNYVEVFLASDIPNLKGPVNGYALRIGYSSGTITLHSVTNGALSTTLYTVPAVVPQNVMAANVWTSIKVTRTGAGIWNVYLDNTTGNGASYVLQGTATSLLYTTSSYFGVWTKFSSTRNTWCYMDNFVVTGIACPDTTKPTVVSVVPSSPTAVQVTFSEKVNLASAQNVSNYLFNNTFNPSSATVQVGDSTKINLVLTPNSLTNCGTDSVRISNVQDRALNAMLPDLRSSTYFQAGNAVWKSVIITEVMADPSPAPNCIPTFEFIEIYNRSNFPVNLNGWKISDTGLGRTITSSNYPLCPGEYAILCGNAANFPGYNNVIAIPSFPSMNNSGDNLGLRSNTGVLVDSVDYTLAWYHDAVKENGGWTLELINPGDTCASINNWAASTDPCGGTPGTQNSVYSTLPDLTAPSLVSISVMGVSNLLVCFDEGLSPAMANIPSNYVVNNGLGTPTSATAAPPDHSCVTLIFPTPIDTSVLYHLTANGVGDCHGNTAPSSGDFLISGPANPREVIINEIFFDPDTNATNLPNVEYVELYNRGTNTFDLFGWRFSDAVSTATLQHQILLPGDYLILCDQADTAEYSGLPYLGLPVWPSLNNTGTEFLHLRDGYGTQVDSVRYTVPGCYQDANKAGGGWSIELINPNDTCGTTANWAASTNPNGGTPGAVNSIYSTAPDLTAPTAISVSVVGASSVEVCFSEPLDVATSSMPANYSVNNGLGNPTSATIQSNGTCVVLVFSTPIDTGTVYTLTATGVEDCAGNSGPTGGTFLISGAGQWRSVIFNEIFFDPDTNATNLPNVEYVELFNRGTDPFDLTGWKYRDSTTTKTLGSYVLLPGQYVILCPTGDTAAYSGHPYLGLSSVPSLNNSGDNLGLRDHLNNLIDSVQYRAPLWYHDTQKDGGGWSIELINPNDSCNAVDNWTASNDPNGGTPGAVNSVFSTVPDMIAPQIVSVQVTGANSVQVCFGEGLDVVTANTASNYVADNGLGTPVSATLLTPANTCVDLVFATPIDTGIVYTLTATGIEDCSGNNAPTAGSFIINGPATFRALVFNEIFPDPDTNATALPGYEYLELYNRSATAWDLNGWTLHNGGRRFIGSYVLQPNAYVILVKESDTAAFSGMPYLGISSWPGLTNGGDELGLRDPFGNPIDTVAYDISWYQDPTKDGGGWSLELINPEDSCAMLGMWIASNDPSGGTPGRQNSVYNNSPDVTPPVLLSVTVVDPTHIELCFDETMDLVALETESNYMIDNGMGVPTTATVSGLGNSCVTLTLATAIDTGTVYTVTVANMADCKGNVAGPLTDQFVLGGTANRYQIVINEIYADETPVIGTLPEAEFVELYNNGPNVVSIRNWTITDRSTTGTLPDHNLFSGGHVILCASSDVAAFSVFGDAIAVSGMPGLNQDGDSLEVYDATGQLMDFAYYDKTWYHDPNKEDGGWSMERQDPAYSCANGGNWHASLDPNGATPGYQNSVSGPFVDTEPPAVTDVVATSRTTVRISFSELMDGSSLLTATYTLTPNIGQATAVAVNGTLPFTVDVTFGVLMDTNVVYCLAVDGAKDCPGNTILSPNSVCFGIASPVAQGDLILNEILFNAYTGGSDYVELYNNSNKIVDLSEVWVGESDPVTHVMLDSGKVSTLPKILLPHSYICLTADRDFQITQYQPIDPAAIFRMSTLPAYDDTDGEVVIYTDSNEVLDRLHFVDDWHFPNLSDKNGVSLERLDFNRQTQSEDNWHSAATTVRYGTPGYRNSEILVPTGDAEVWLQPETFSPDQDGFEDIIAINYHFLEPDWNVRVLVLDNKGRQVRLLKENTLVGTEQGTFIWDGTTDGLHKADVGVYVLLVEAMNPRMGEKKHFKLGCVLAAKL